MGPAPLPPPEPRIPVSKVVVTSRTAKMAMIASRSPLRPVKEDRGLSSKEGGGDGEGGAASPPPSAGAVICGGDVEVIAELKWEGDTSDCAMVKPGARTPQSGQKRAPSGSSRPQFEQ